MANLRTLLLVVTPAIAMATLAVGLKVGASGPMRAAIVEGSPPSAGVDALAWRVQTLVSVEGGAPKPRAVKSLRVEATSGARTARWTGASGDDGIAEISLDLPGIHAGDLLGLVVTDDADGAVLARGDVHWEHAPKPDPEPPWNAFSRREGGIDLDVAVFGQRLVVGEKTDVWVRAASGDRGLDGAQIVPKGEMGLEIATREATTDERGWARIQVIARTHVASLSLNARREGKHGEWAGALAVAAGADAVPVPSRIPPGENHRFDLFVASARATTYVEIDDASGRAAAAVVDLGQAADGMRGRFVAPPLRSGLYWLVTAAERNGAETMQSATMARPFFVAPSDAGARAFGPLPAACGDALGPCLATAVPPPFPRWTAMDGFPRLASQAAQRRERGVSLAIASVCVAALLEAVLIVDAVLAARRGLKQAKLKSRGNAARVVTALLLTLLAFGLIAAMLLATGVA